MLTRTMHVKTCNVTWHFRTLSEVAVIPTLLTTSNMQGDISHLRCFLWHHYPMLRCNDMRTTTATDRCEHAPATALVVCGREACWWLTIFDLATKWRSDADGSGNVIDDPCEIPVLIDMLIMDPWKWIHDSLFSVPFAHRPTSHSYGPSALLLKYRYLHEMPPLFKRGDELGEGLSLNRWKVVRKVGEGQFAEVYECSDAMKDNKRVSLPDPKPFEPDQQDSNVVSQNFRLRWMYDCRVFAECVKSTMQEISLNSTRFPCSE